MLHPAGFPWRWLWLDAGCIALMGGVLTKAFLRDLRRYPLLPLKDPRLSEALGLFVVPAPELIEAPDETGPLASAPPDSV